MRIKWNKVTWYSQVLAIVLFVAVFLVGICIGSYKQRLGRGLATSADYSNKDFGVEFDLYGQAAAGIVVEANNRLTMEGFSSFIERHEIKDGQTIKDAIFELVPNQDNCEIVYEPWIANDYSQMASKGQMAIHLISKKQPEYIATMDAERVNADTLTKHGDSIARMVAKSVGDCSSYVRFNGGVHSYFLYDPVNAPNRFYFVDDINMGDPSFYSDVRVLPD